MQRVLSRVLAVGVAAATGLTVGIGAVSAQQDYSAVKIQGEKVGGSVHMLASGVAGNIGVSAGPDGVLIVDDQFAPLADKIKASLAEIEPGDPAFVVNTHFHDDHTGGNQVFGRHGVIVAQTNVRKRMIEGAPAVNQQPAPPEALPVITYDDGISIHFNGEEIRVVHLPPGHTDGDSYIYFTGSKVAHLGDDYFSHRFPFVDLASGGSVRGLEKVVARLLAELPADTRLIPGHGEVTGMDGLRDFHQMLVDCIDAVRKARSAGQSLEQIQKTGVPDKWKGYAWPFISADSWLSMVYRDLS